MHLVLYNERKNEAFLSSSSDIPVTVVMPVVAPIMKIQNCKNYGANVIIHGQNIEEARTHALGIGEEKGLLYVNG